MPYISGIKRTTIQYVLCMLKKIPKIIITTKLGLTPLFVEKVREELKRKGKLNFLPLTFQSLHAELHNRKANNL